MPSYQPADRPTMYFIGVTTGQSSIMKVFPAWADHLGLDGAIKGIDFPLDDAGENYLAAVEFIKNDPLSLGGLVTSHKVNLMHASRHLFDELDPFAQTLGEVSSISKRDGRLIGHAKDPITARAALAAIVDQGYWKHSGGHLCVLGSGGASRALALHLHDEARRGGDVPDGIVVTAIEARSLAEMRQVHDRIGFAPTIEYVLTASPQDADRLVNELPAGSMVVNATGMGKDRPGSPLTDEVVFPERGIVWEFNYRGKLTFLDQAKSQAGSRDLTVTDGWIYFLHGWTSVIAEVFDIDIPRSGPSFDRLSEIAAEVTGRQV